ncbi:MAG: EamA family transporter [Puniceicoccales bacterium]|jgi:drug/metabolite transporter (DMT)-like permease|nr:EamA family transporter [Puniceicoccales bacterium]
MFFLVLVSLVWAFSFGLIGAYLAGVDPSVAAAARLALASLVFLPFLRLGRVPVRYAVGFALLGVVQFGFMYIFYLAAFGPLKPYEVALFTIFTPLYVTLFDDLLEHRFEFRWLAAAVLAALGAGILLWRTPSTLSLLLEPSLWGRLRLCLAETLGGEKWHGFLLMQLSNACFAAGQIAHKRLRPRIAAANESALFAWAIAGGAVAATAYAVATGADWRTLENLTPALWLVLAYLGVVASGLCFFLWNRGATRVAVGTLAVFNNLKIPLGVVCSLFVFATPAPDIWKLLASFGIMFAAVFMAEKRSTEKREKEKSPPREGKHG